MKRALFCSSVVLILAASLFADTNLRIDDLGLHGHRGNPQAVRLIVRNPSPQPQQIHLRVAANLRYGVDVGSSVMTDLNLGGGEQRSLELPIPVGSGTSKITADAVTASGTVVGHDAREEPGLTTSLIVLMCASAEVCQNAQSQIQFSGTIENRADKNRQLSFEVVADPREHWWAYSSAKAIVLAMPVANFTPVQRDALEGFLRLGGRLVLVEDEIADPGFLAAYRHTPASPSKERVGKGDLFRVAGLSSNTLGDFFAGPNLPGVLLGSYTRGDPSGAGWLRRRFAVSFNFPRLQWLLIWLAAYIVIIGVLNFAVLRRLRRLEWGWITVCVLAVAFAAGFYFSSASRRPSGFRLDNLAAYYLDARSPLAAANYNLRLSAPERRSLVASVADLAVFTVPNNYNGAAEPNAQIWVDMNGRTAPAESPYDIRLGPPRQVELSMLKWSFRDLDLEGLHEFPGTLHFVAPNRVRNDTGQYFREALYLDYASNALYRVPALAPGDEIQLDSMAPTTIRAKNQPPNVFIPDAEFRNLSLEELAHRDALPLPGRGRVFVGFTDGPILPVSLNIAHQSSAHALIIVALEQP